MAVLSTVEEYDPETDTWTRKADMPTPRNVHAASVVNGKIYVIGGSPDASRVEEYDPKTDTWTRKANLPTPRGTLSCSVVNGYIYAIGGNPSNTSQGLSTVEAYDTGVGIRVNKLSPQESSITGGESIAIFGKYFPPGANITIGGEPMVLPIIWAPIGDS